MDNTEINGYQNEIMFAKKINGKKIKDLYPNLQDLVIELFGFVILIQLFIVGLIFQRRNMIL